MTAPGGNWRRVASTIPSMSKPTPDLPFSEPHNWCDRQCERCPLASECEVPKRDLDARVTSEARGEEWDPLDSAVEDTCRDLDAFVERLDVDDDPAGAPPDLLGADRLRSAGGVLMLTFAKDAVRPGEATDVRKFMNVVLLVATKEIVLEPAPVAAPMADPKAALATLVWGVPVPLVPSTVSL